MASKKRKTSAAARNGRKGGLKAKRTKKGIFSPSYKRKHKKKK